MRETRKIHTIGKTNYLIFSILMASLVSAPRPASALDLVGKIRRFECTQNGGKSNRAKSVFQTLSTTPDEIKFAFQGTNIVLRVNLYAERDGNEFLESAGGAFQFPTKSKKKFKRLDMYFKTESLDLLRNAVILKVCYTNGLDALTNEIKVSQCVVEPIAGSKYWYQVSTPLDFAEKPEILDNLTIAVTSRAVNSNGIPITIGNVTETYVDGTTFSPNNITFSPLPCQDIFCGNLNPP